MIFFALLLYTALVFEATVGDLIACPWSCLTADEMCRNVFSVTGGAALRATKCSMESNTANTTFTGELICQCSPSSTSVNSTASFASVSWSPSEGVCNRTDDFEVTPPHFSCNPTIGVCPTTRDCGNLLSPFASSCAMGVLTCTTVNVSSTNATLLLQCRTCDGGSLAIHVEESSRTCVKEYTAPTSSCSPATTCNGHGCCAPVSPLAISAEVGVCSCFQDATRGYWNPATGCTTCDPSYDSGGSTGLCTNAKPQLVVLLQSLGASPSTMILPNLIIVVVFVLFGLIRRVWPSDDTFAATMSRRVGLPWCRSAEYSTACFALPTYQRSDRVDVQAQGDGEFEHPVRLHIEASIERQLVYFHKKAIPKRPADSVGVVNRWDGLCAEQLRHVR